MTEFYKKWKLNLDGLKTFSNVSEFKLHNLPGVISAFYTAPNLQKYLLLGTENGLMLLDRSGQGKVYQLISRRRFQQMEVLEGQNILVTISGKKNRVRVYYLSWLKSKILRTDNAIERRAGWINVGDLQVCKLFYLWSPHLQSAKIGKFTNW